MSSVVKRSFGCLIFAATAVLAQTPRCANSSLRLHGAVCSTRPGQPVSDLTAKDFDIVDSGKAQTILFFRKPETAVERLPQSEL